MSKIRIPKHAMVQIASGELDLEYGPLSRTKYLNLRKKGYSNLEADYILREKMGQIKKPKRISKLPTGELIRRKVKILRKMGPY